MSGSRTDVLPRPLRRHRILVGYDGTGYAGWQIQPNGMSVQQRLQEAIAALTGEAPIVHGSGRTDQGVHARGQVAHFDLVRSFTPVALCRGINAHLPPDIRVLSCRRVRGDFHARRSVVEKEYRYFIWNGEILPPTSRLYRLHVRRPLNVSNMNLAARLLEGEHDFAAFSANPRREVESTRRTVRVLKVLKRGPEIAIVAAGSGFLYRMVRSLAGFLIRVGEGSVPPQQARVILESGERTARVPTAPPQGLFLWKVTY